MKKRAEPALAVCVAAALTILGCARQGQQASSALGAKKLRLAFVTNNASS